MVTIWKFDLTVGTGGDLRILKMPAGAKFLHVGLEPSDPQPQNLRLWAFVDPTAELEDRQVRIALTGHWLAGYEEHVGTVVAPPFVWHVFEIR